jgi:trafficking protein particle complex subunit 6
MVEASSQQKQQQQPRTEHVSEQIYEFLLSELVVYVKDSCAPAVSPVRMSSSSENNSNSINNVVVCDEESLTVAAEMAAAKLERMGYAVGYRFTERLAQNKTWNAVPNQDMAAAVAAQQLEAVKFLCKEVWMEIFGKQIDKLQTNHRGVFVLKDLDLTWLQRFPAGTEHARVTAIRLLAFPCGLVRGCLSNLGIPAVVSCDFLADGQNMSACSFNIKVK